jgi:hypothetical protein
MKRMEAQPPRMQHRCSYREEKFRMETNSSVPMRVSTPFCRVEGILEKEIGFEVWLPKQGWNGKFLGEGIGGYAGSISMSYRAMADALARGYATASTDTGHQASSNESEWALGNPERVIASHKTDGKVDRTRPLCPYPQAASYKGSGSTDDAASFACK